MTLLLSAGVWDINFSKSSKNILLGHLIRVNAVENARMISVSANDLLRCLQISSLKTASFFVCDGNQMGRARLIRGICKLADYRESRYVVFLSAAKGERNNTRANETAKECCVCPA